MIKGEKYILSFWVRTDCATKRNNGEEFYIDLNSGGFFIPATKEEKIDCWQRVEAEFTVPANSGTDLSIGIVGPVAMGYYYYDDFRILPFNAHMKSYVYDPKNYRLLAELDENNYATFYNYDEEGFLVQVKKETERGIKTLQTTRQNMKGRN